MGGMYLCVQLRERAAFCSVNRRSVADWSGALWLVVLQAHSGSPHSHRSALQDSYVPGGVPMGQPHMEGVHLKARANGMPPAVRLEACGGAGVCSGLACGSRWNGGNGGRMVQTRVVHTRGRGVRGA